MTAIFRDLTDRHDCRQPPSGQRAAGTSKQSTLASPDLLDRRVGMLDTPHVAELERLRAELARHGPVPHFDPCDGGDRARLLLLLETPGPGAAPLRFVSRDNPTGTAANLRRFCAIAGLEREETVIWNTVPWVVHSPGARNRPVRRGEVAAGLQALPALLARLPELRVVVLAGRVAQRAGEVVRTACPQAVVLAMPHPSPTYVNTSPSIAAAICDVLRAAAGIIQSGTPPMP